MTERSTFSTAAHALPARTPTPAAARYLMRLYITGSTRNSTRAITNIRKICEAYLDGRHELEVVDISQHPALTADAQIIAAPTLVRMSPLPVRRLIGDMSRTDRVLSGLDLHPAAAAAAPLRRA